MKIHDAIKAWVDRVSLIDETSRMPECPFAKEAWKNDRVEVYRDNGFLKSNCTSKSSTITPGHLAMVVFNPENYDSGYVSDIAEQLNKLFPNLLFLATHPDNEFPSHPTLGVIFIQHKAEMIEAVNKLRKTTYYDSEPLPEWYIE